MMNFLPISLRKSWRMPVVAALAVALAGAAWLWNEERGNSAVGHGRSRRTAVVAVETTPVERVTVRDVRIFSGTLHANTAFDVAPKINGRLQQLVVDVGDPVTKGQIVARLDDDEQVQLVLQARAELAVARAALAEAKSLLVLRQRRFKRSRRLFEQGIGAEMDLEVDSSEADAQQARVQVARAQVGQRQALLRAEEVRLSYTVIRADWNGEGRQRVVGERYANEGEMLAANKPILSVLDIGSLIAVVHATEGDYPHLRTGLPVAVIADAFPERRFAGTVARLAPQFEQASRQARMEVTVPNPQQSLKPGMFIRVEVEVSRTRNAMVIPAESVVIRSGRRGVFLVDPEKSVARFVPVRTGLALGNRIQVIAPELKGQVASLGQHLLRDGAPVRLVSSSNGIGPPAGRPGAEGSQHGKAP